jgi:hypothetical protein
MYLDRQGTSVLHPLPSPSHNLDKASQRMAHPSTHPALPQVACCHTETGPKLSATDVTQVAFAFVQHTLEVQVSRLHVGPNLVVSKELSMKVSRILSFTLFTFNIV